MCLIDLSLNQILESIVFHKEACVTMLLGTLLGIQDYKRVKFPKKNDKNLFSLLTHNFKMILLTTSFQINQKKLLFRHRGFHGCLIMEVSYHLLTLARFFKNTYLSSHLCNISFPSIFIQLLCCCLSHVSYSRF